MDYQTKPVSRAELRNIATLFKKVYCIPNDTSVPVIELLDIFCVTTKNVNYEVVADYDLPLSIPAVTEVDEVGEFTIKIKESIYNGALYEEIGGYRNHIMHEICHVVLYKLGFTPTLERSFINNKIQPAYSAEWQAKALCGEIMMPYEETKNMTVEEIANVYKVSELSAQIRKKY